LCGHKAGSGQNGRMAMDKAPVIDLSGTYLDLSEFGKQVCCFPSVC